MTETQTWDAVQFLWRVENILEREGGRPRKPPTGKRPIAVTYDGVPYKSLTKESTPAQVSLTGAFRLVSLRTGRKGMKHAEQAFLSAYWHPIPGQAKTLAVIDEYEWDTREIVRALRRARKTLWKGVK